jgi:signal transduction histidine kinase
MAAAVRRPLLWKYAATLSLLVSVLLLAGGALGGWQLYQSERRSIERLQQAEARFAATEITGFMARVQGALRASAAKFSVLDKGAGDELRFELVSLLRHHPEVAELRWIAASGREQLALARVGIDEADSGRDWSADPRYRGARDAGQWVGPVVFRKGSEPHVSVWVASPGGGSVLGAELNLKRVRDLVGRGSSATTYVVDGDGHLIAHPDIGLVLARTDIGALPQVQGALRGRASGPALDLAGEPVIASHARVEPLAWTVFVEQPVASALAPVLATVLPALAIAGLGLAAAVLASFVLAQRLVKPIQEIEAQARRLGDGRFEAPIELRGDDELQALAEQFNRMAARLQDTLATQERRITERTHELKLANEAKTRFLAAASHDLRQPIHALGLFADQLRASPLPAGSASLAERVVESAQHLATLLDALLDLSQLDGGAVPAEPRAVALQPLLARLARQYAPAAEAKGLALTAVPTRAWVHTDPLLLERILQNLLGNAVRYTAQGRVLLGCRRRGNEVELLVADTGCGIAAQHLPFVFDEFWRAGRGAGDGGIGLGLAIVRRLAQLLGHRVWIESQPGRGTVARLRLPRAEPQASPLAAAAPLADRLHARRVLVVDDEAAAREALQGLLQRWGCEVRLADGMDQALAQAAGSELVLCDLELGGPGSADGVEVVRALRAACGPGLRCAFVSGTSSPELIAKARGTGLPITFKPAPPARLRSLLEHLARSEP